MKQYIPQKPTKRGLKVWMRADSTNGYVSEFQIYVGKEKGSVENKLGQVQKEERPFNLLEFAATAL